MNGRRRAFPLIVVLAVLRVGSAQNAPPHAPAKDDYSQEAAMIEEMTTKIAFDNDGNFTREETGRVRVQNDTGVKEWGLLSFSFESATQTAEIDYVRVHKADGRTVVTPPDNVQDLDAEITRSAPFYSDLREKHVAVKGLGKGDILEFEVHWRSTKPLIPGQFWFQYNFHREGVVLDERVEIKVPAERAVRVKGPQPTQTVTTEANSRVYSWTYSKLQSAKEPGSDEKKQIESARGLLPAPDVQLTSFQSWEEVGRWYWNLQKDRIEPSPAIRAKAAELTQGLTDDATKLRALYTFVSTQYRYIGIAFGIGRYQPHAADDVLTNSYGDCKDKHTLLASLLQAAGITLYPALINSSRKLDPDVPSPAQFDHIIGYLPSGKGKDKDKDAVWLDTTIEVSPFGYLAPRLRDKPALVMAGDKSIQLVTTAADSLFPNKDAFKIDGKLDADGTFEAKVEDTTQGDLEVVLRTAFRQVPQPQWQDLVQRISHAMGYAGTVSEISASKPELISEPFHFSYSYSRKDYPDWKSDRHFTVPGTLFYMPPVRDDASYPVWLGPPMEEVSDSKVEIPPGYQPQTPSNVDLKYDFAEYHASYSLDHGVLVAKRQLLTKMREIPVAEFDDYRNFLKSMQNDVYQYVQTSSVGAQPATNAPVSGTLASFMSAIRGLPESHSSDANRLEDDARSMMTSGHSAAAITTFQRVIEADPTFTRAWLELAIAYLSSRQISAALDALRKAVDSDPKQLVAHKLYAFVLTTLRRTDAAMDAWRETVKLAPDDPEANLDFGTFLMQQKRYAEAVPYIETAAKRDPSPTTQTRLGVAYLQSGQLEHGTAILQKLVEADSSPGMLNDIAYYFAEANVNLAKALEYAQQAVEKQEKESHGVELSNLRPEDLACTLKLGMFWDTLGWVHFRLGHLDQAESYLYAAWLLQQAPVVADHLGQVYEQQKKTKEAIHLYRLALATPEAQAPGGTWDETRHRLERLTGAKAPKAMELLRGDPSGSELSELRTAKLKRLVSGTAEAEFFLLFGPGPKVERLQFVTGSNKLRSAGSALVDANFQVAFPEHSSARLLRRGILMCTDVSGCNAVLFTPDSVKSVK
jgi:tetratricopeptide (TPR) repeat protein